MKTTIKIALSVAVAAALVPQGTRANTITGSISFNGNVTPHTDTAGIGPVASDYSLAHSLVFGQSFVSAGANGSFAGVTAGSGVSLFSPLVINPATVPLQPASGALWTTAIGGFNFTLTTLTEDALISPFDTLTLRGTGLMDDGNVADDTTGTWVATFTTATSGEGVTFSWNSSSSASVPEAGTSFILMGLGLIALGGFARFRKQVSA